MLTHIRQRLVFTILGGAKRQPSESAAAFKRRAPRLFDGIAAPELITELDRIGAQRGGIAQLTEIGKPLVRPVRLEEV